MQYSSIDQLMNTKIILATSLLLMTAAIISCALPNTVLGQGDLTSKTVILLDDGTGNDLGWDPDGFEDIFIITDLSVSPLKSTILVNTVQSNFVNCSVDYISVNGFEVLCDSSPAEGGELHYTIFNKEEVESSGMPFLEQDLEGVTMAESLTAGNRTLPNSTSALNTTQNN
jgi:hypothetical protein